ncbi:hypothetical protein [Kitasatospora sp. NPDC094015]|uniref:hypothetical protein n=1 Tax=Kitasatospora sp. NPDC094015 TaxID=3155205 RepID=UPI003334A2F3
MNEQNTVPQAGRRLIGLYPARYRELYGEDIAATFAEVTEGLTGRALLRERLDLASHALRLRLGIASTDPAGRILAGAAPIALALGAGVCVSDLLWIMRDFVPVFTHARPGQVVRGTLVFVLAFIPWITALLCAATGRWRPARAAAVLAVALDLVFSGLILTVGYGTLGELCRVGGLAALVLLAPPDLVDTARRGRRTVVAVAVTTALTLTWVWAIPIAEWRPYIVASLADLWLFVAVAALLVVHLSARRPDRLRCVGIALAAVPWLLEYSAGGNAEQAVVGFTVLIGGAFAVGGVVQLIRRMLGTEPAEPA